MKITAFDIAERFIGITEVAGETANPMILGMLKLDGEWPEDDSVPWCSAFMNYCFWLLRLPRSKSLLARSWLNVGRPVSLSQATVGFDVVILSRGALPQPGPENTRAPGHVGLYAGVEGGTLGRKVLLLGGNQSDTVSVAGFDDAQILGIRRIYTE